MRGVSPLMLAFRPFTRELERVVERPDGPLDSLAPHEEGDPDRRRRDVAGLEAEVTKRRKGARRDSRMASHPGADGAHLGEVAAVGPPRAETIERALDLPAILARRREDEALADLDQCVDRDARLGDRLEERGGVGVPDLVEDLIERMRDSRDHRLLEHPLVRLPYPRPALVRERRADVELHAVVPGELDGA